MCCHPAGFFSIFLDPWNNHGQNYFASKVVAAAAAAVAVAVAAPVFLHTYTRTQIKFKFTNLPFSMTGVRTRVLLI